MKKTITFLLVLVLFALPFANLSVSAAIPSSDFTLKSLEVRGYTLVQKDNGRPIFDPEVKNYAVTVPFEVTRLSLRAVTNCDKAAVTFEGCELNTVGTNIVYVNVTAENGSKRKYKIYATRLAYAGTGSNNSSNVQSAVSSNSQSSTGESSSVNSGSIQGGTIIAPSVTSAPSSDFTLKSLTVKGQKLLQKDTNIMEFDTEVRNYAITVPFSVETLDLEFQTNCEKATAEIIDAELKYVGTNITKIVVTAENGSKRTYKIYTTRLAPEKESGNSKAEVSSFAESVSEAEIESDETVVESNVVSETAHQSEPNDDVEKIGGIAWWAWSLMGVILLVINAAIIIVILINKRKHTIQDEGENNEKI